jgi:RNA polymerase sigma-70 factor (ECF subfamily)
MNNTLIIALEDKEILENFSQNRTEIAATAFVRKYQKFVFSTAYRYLKDFDDAEDAAQESFIRAIKHLKDFKGDSSIQTWLYRITVNVSLSMLRKRKIRNMFNIIGKSDDESPENDIPDYNSKPDRILEGKQANEAFMRALEMLPEKQRETFALRYFEDMTYEEISKVLGTSVGGLKANFYHAVKKLAQFMNEEVNYG